MNQSNMYMGCPNLDVTVEGKGLFSSGRLVCKCRAQGNAVVNPNVVKTLCVDNPGLDYVQCCHLAHTTRHSIKPASYESCRCNKGIYK